MKTVVIVGSHSATREIIPWHLDADYWVFNEAKSGGWVKKVDAVFQMHHPAVWKNPMNRNDNQNGKHADWIRERHPFPIYMQQKYPGVPSAVRYPREGVIRKFQNALSVYDATRGDVEQKKGYFTSSVDYAIALALFKGYKRILLYGVEMESNTEYIYQREGVMLWVGIAVGAGVEVEWHTGTGNLIRPHYGYDGLWTIQREHLQERRADLDRFLEQATREHEDANTYHELVMREMREGDESMDFSEDQVKRFQDSIKQQTQTLIALTMLRAAIKENDKYQAKADEMDRVSGQHYFSRNEFELTAARAGEAAEDYQKKMHVQGGRAHNAWKNLEGAVAANVEGPEFDRLAVEYAAAHNDYLRAAGEYGTAEGVFRENAQMVEKTDELIKAAGGQKAEEAMLRELGLPYVDGTIEDAERILEHADANAESMVHAVAD